MFVTFKEPVTLKDKISSSEMEALLEAVVEGLINVRERKKDGSVILYGQDKDKANIPRDAIEKYIHYKREIKATSEDGKRFFKELSIYEKADEERVIISFGGYANYELDLFLEDHKKNEIKNLCIDAGGRNHGTGPVWVLKEDIEKALDAYNYKGNIEEINKVISTMQGELIRKYTYAIPGVSSHEVDSTVMGGKVNLNGDESIVQGKETLPCTVLLDKENGVQGFILESGEVIKASGENDFETRGEKEPVTEKIISLLENSEEDIMVSTVVKQ